MVHYKQERDGTFFIFVLCFATLLSIGRSRIIQVIHQEFSGVSGVKLITPINSYVGVKDCVVFPNRDKTGWCNFSWEVRLLNPQNLFGVIANGSD